MMSVNNGKKRIETMHSNSPQYKNRSLFAIVFALLLVLSVFSAFAQEQPVGNTDSPSETPVSSDTSVGSESAPSSDDSSPSMDSISQISSSEEESKEVYVNLDDLASDEEPLAEETTAEEIIEESMHEEPSVSDTEEVVQEESKEVYVELEQVEPVASSKEPVKKEEVYLPIDEVVTESGSSSGSSHPVDDESFIEEALIEEPLVQHDPHSLSEEELIEEPSVVEESTKTEETISYVFYKGNQKIIETKAEKGRDLEIERDEALVSEGEMWKKEVKVYSEEHYDRELTVFTDIAKTKEENIQIYWKEEDRYLDFDAFDIDDDGLIERIAWIVPHLSEQNFDIIIDFTQISNESEELLIYTISKPSGSIESVIPLNFTFGMNYTTPENVTCDFELRNESQFVVNHQESAPGAEWGLSVESLANGAYLWDMDCTDFVNNQTSNTLAGSFVINLYYAPPTPQIYFGVSDTTIDEDDTITFYVNGSNATLNPRYYNIDFGDSSSPHSSGNLDVPSFNHAVSHTYSTDGTFTARLTGFLGSTSIDETIQISVASTVDTDTQDPKVALISPADDHTFVLDDLNEEIAFSYNVTDNVRVDNCTLHIYYYNNTQIGNLVYTDFDSSIASGATQEIKLKEFDEGDYTWDVECYDNSTNFDDASRDFEVLYEGSTYRTATQNTQEISQDLNTDFARSDEIDELIEHINTFLVEEERYGIDEKEAVVDLGIIEDMKFYKKKLLQMRTDLSHNLEYVRGEDNREARRSEIYTELDEISEKVVLSVTVDESKEYTKNSIDSDFEDIVSAYADARTIQLTSRNIKDMAKQNEAIQSKITVSTTVRQVTIQYPDSSQDITLVTKAIEFKDTDFDSIIEVIPKELAVSDSEVTFLTDMTVLRSDPLFEIDLAAIKNDKFIYYFNSPVHLEAVETTNTVAFIEEIPRETLGTISGFATFVGGDGETSVVFYFSWILVVIVAFFILVASVRKIRINQWKKDDSFRQMHRLFIETKTALKNKEVEIAREKYNEAELLYPHLPQQSKKFVFGKITQLSVEIDKKDIVNLVKEFVTASQEGRQDDALLLYENIQSLYPKMSPRFKKKVFEKMRPHVKRLTSS